MSTLTPLWAVKANVVDDRAFGPLGLERKRGAKHLRAGAKVWAIDAFWGMGGEDVTVVGRHRGSLRYIKLVMPTHHLHGFQSQLVYSPTVIALINEHGIWPKDEANADALAQMLMQVADRIRAAPSQPRLFRVVGVHDGKTVRLRNLLADGELGANVDIPVELVDVHLREPGTTVRWTRSDVGANRLELVDANADP